MADMTEVELMPRERDMILKYGYLFAGEKAKLQKMADDDSPRRLRISLFNLEQLIGNLSISVNEMHEKDLDHNDPVIEELGELAESLEGELARAEKNRS